MTSTSTTRAAPGVVTTVAAAGLLVGVSSDAAPSTVTGTGAGVALSSHAILMLVGSGPSGTSSVAVSEPIVTP